MRSTTMLASIRMKIKISYKSLVYIAVVGLFVLYAISFILISNNRENKLKKEIIQTNQSIYTQVVSSYIDKYGIDQLRLLSFLPQELRISVLDEDGSILYDNKVPDKQLDTNQKKNWVEITRALLYGEGFSVRESTDGFGKYAYYAIFDGEYIIRTGMPYNSLIGIPEKMDFYYTTIIIVLFLSVIFVFSWIYFDSRKSIFKLQQFVSSFKNVKQTPSYVKHKDEDLEKLQLMFVEIYGQLAYEEKNTKVEREKLLQHFHYAEEGISFFTREYENIFTNVHFIQYLNVLFPEPTFEVKSIFTNPIFGDVVDFIESPKGKKNFIGKLYGNGKSFGVRVIIFPDKSFEIIIRKVTEAELGEMDAAAMTNNIAHELKTPVTSMRGFLETVLEHKNLEPERQEKFLEKAYKQCLRLDEIIQDMVLLSKAIYAPQFFLKEDINIHQLLTEILKEDKEKYDQNNITVNVIVNEDVVLKGNRTLLTSIFRNLGTNAIKYAGENSTVTIYNYMEDSNYYYFSFSDNGVGVDEKHLLHLFNRFYRISDGRTRDKGGSGLGLAIVKDAVFFHHGEIYVKNRSGGGLEFLFTLRKTDAG